jgi:hypothetical protein
MISTCMASSIGLAQTMDVLSLRGSELSQPNLESVILHRAWLMRADKAGRAPKKGRWDLKKGLFISSGR